MSVKRMDAVVPGDVIFILKVRWEGDSDFTWQKGKSTIVKLVD